MRRNAFKIIALFVVVFFCMPTLAQEEKSLSDRFSYGVEWGYSQCFLLARDYNFLSEEGYRVFEQYTDFDWHANGQIFARVGFSLTDRTQISLLGGYFGTGENNRLLPALLRLAYFPATERQDGWQFWLQGGPAWHVHAIAGKMALLAEAGAGYRLCLHPACSMDLLVGLKYLYDHPSIPNPEAPGNVPAHNIRKNVAGHCALDISIAFSF